MPYFEVHNLPVNVSSTGGSIFKICSCFVDILLVIFLPQNPRQLTTFVLFLFMYVLDVLTNQSISYELSVSSIVLSVIPFWYFTILIKLMTFCWKWVKGIEWKFKYDHKCRLVIHFTINLRIECCKFEIEVRVVLMIHYYGGVIRLGFTV